MIAAQSIDMSIGVVARLSLPSAALSYSYSSSLPLLQLGESREGSRVLMSEDHVVACAWKTVEALRRCRVARGQWSLIEGGVFGSRVRRDVEA